MEPAQFSRPNTPIQGISPYHPPLNSPVLAPTMPPSSILENSTTYPEIPIFNPIPTRQSQLVEAGPPTTSMATEVDTTPHNVPAEIVQHADREHGAQVATTERLRHRANMSHRQCQHERLEERDPKVAEREKEHRAQRRGQLRTRKEKQRRLQGSSTDALTDSLSNLSVDGEPVRNDRDESIQNARREDREDREDRARLNRRAAQKHRRAGRLQQMRDVERSSQCAAEEMDVVGEEDSEGESMATDVQRTTDATISINNSGGPAFTQSPVIQRELAETDKPRDSFEV